MATEATPEQLAVIMLDSLTEHLTDEDFPIKVDFTRKAEVALSDGVPVLRFWTESGLAYNIAVAFDEGASSFKCPECGRVSHHPEDLRQGYCGACHKFTGKAS